MSERGTMQLRKTVRPPQRLEQDSLYAPSSRQMLRREKKATTQNPRYIEYDPKLPPAAFPTLDRPHEPVPETQNGERGAQQSGGGDCHEDIPSTAKRSDKGTSLESLSILTKTPLPQNGDFQHSFLSRISADQLENLKASNGRFNPIWMNNMAKMAATRQNDLVLEDMEDSDLDEVMGGTESSSVKIRRPTWADLTPRMQAEIFINLLQDHDCPKVCRMLGLTVEEHGEIQELLDYRQRQNKLEDQSLQSMRARQLRELLKIDNSSKRQHTPHQLVFRKITRQTFRKLQDRIDTDADFFCCQSSELDDARAFLCIRRMDPKFAGSWGSSTVIVPEFQGDGEKEDVEELLQTVGANGRFCLSSASLLATSLTATEAFTAPTVTTSTTTNPKPREVNTTQEEFFNWLGIGNIPANTKLEYFQCTGGSVPTAPSNWLTLLYKKTINPEERRLAKRKVEDLKLIQYQDRNARTIDPAVLRLPQLSLSEYRCGQDRALKKRRPNYPSKASKRADPGLTLDLSSLKINTNRSNFIKCLHEPTIEICNFFEDALAPETAVLNEQLVESTIIEKKQSPSRDATLPGLVKTSTFIRLSPSPPLQATAESSSSSPEKNGFEFDDLVSTSTVPTTPSVKSASPSETFETDLNGTDTGCESALLARSVVIEAQAERTGDICAGNEEDSESRGECDEDGDEIMPDDEMVLLPTSLGHH
ncbi:hypothetical protein BJY04DRAFT_218731 [Aspergillus karnatakaensis]|uniref:uncharacterized protein n=1 Tax=Aspergillus karnatakaensis TaxID=1810916 RepID=UPI003CCCB30D